MDLNKKYKYQFYQQQNIQLRKEIRQIDLKIANTPKTEQKQDSHSCIFLVLGPSKSGKTSLLRTLQLALNGTEGWGFSYRASITLVDIKKSPRWQVEGVKQVKEIDRKYIIQGWQLDSIEKPCIRYKKVLQLVQKGLGFCLQQAVSVSPRSAARICLICIDISQQLSYEQFTYLRFLKLDLMQRNLKLLYILTKSDSLPLISQSQRSLWIENKIKQLIKDFEIKDRQDIILFENYWFKDDKKEDNKIRLSHSNNKVEVNEEINFYSLQLIIRMIRECEILELVIAKEQQFVLCGCN